MHGGDVAAFVVLLFLGGVGVRMFLRASARQAEDVLFDLTAFEEEAAEQRAMRVKAHEGARAMLSDTLGSIGLFTSAARKRFTRVQLIMPFIGAASAVLVGLLGAHTAVSGVLMLSILGLAIGYLASRARYRRAKRNYIRSIEFYLPIVMERIVMAVQAGLDVIPALHNLSRLDLETLAASGPRSLGKNERFAALDPVTRLLRIVVQFTEAGLSFEQSMREIADLVECSALRHAFVHLAVAQREGGELVTPLRELSDATQLYYQESIEEELAAMPVKATVPLLCTFAGLIMIFITAPLVQVITMTAKAMPK